MSAHSSSPTVSTRRVYTDQQIFDREMEQHLRERIWVYCGHESQVPNPGDYYAVTIGRQPMIMVRQPDDERAACSTTAARIAACSSSAT